ncbi:MAG: hypothetical protein K2G15_00985 [Muribaculaceae bacterium]|nr:hypothetical protein [Muribaculaceae bacterium]
MKKVRNRKDLQITDLLIAHGPAGYGIYVMLTQYLTERKSLRRREDIARIAYELHAPAEMVRSVLEDFGLFECTDGLFANESSPAKEPKQPEPAKPAESANPSKPSDNSDDSEPSDNQKSPKRPKPSGARKIPAKELLKRRPFLRQRQLRGGEQLNLKDES